MGFHTFPVERAAKLEDVSRYRYCSRDELLDLLEPDPVATIADLGSGTGFYTDDVAPFFQTVYAVDVQEAMHETYREKGIPDTVQTVTAEADDLPLEDDHLDLAFSTMTYHEYATEAALVEVRRVLRDSGSLVTVDWSSEGSGEAGPPLDQRYDLSDALTHHRSVGFEVETARTRPETFVVVARA